MAEVIRLTSDQLDAALAPRKTSTDADVHAENVGESLCKARQRSGKMLMDVWRDLKIPPHYLLAIESSRFEALPGRVYAIGFVRSYAAYLGLDSETFVARVKAEMAGSDAKLPVIGPLPPPERKDRLEAEVASKGGTKQPVIGTFSPPNRKLSQGLIAWLIIPVLIYFGYSFLGSAQRMTEPPVTAVPARLAAEAGLPQKQVGAPPLARVEQLAPISAERGLPPSHDVGLTQVPSGQPLASLESAPALPTEPAHPPATEMAQSQAISVRAEPAASLHPPLPVGTRYGIRNRNSRITLRVHRPTRIAVAGSRNRIFIDRSLHAGDTYRIPNMVGLKLSAPDAGAIEVILDDTTIGFVGKDGVVARGLSLDPQSIIDRQQHG